MSPAFRAAARDAALDAVARWGAGRMGRGRWLWLGPLTAMLAAAAVEDAMGAGPAAGPLDRLGRLLTAGVLGAVFLNVATKRVRDLDLGGWTGCLALHAALAASALSAPLFAVLLIAYVVVMFLAPGRR